MNINQTIMINKAMLSKILKNIKNCGPKKIKKFHTKSKGT